MAGIYNHLNNIIIGNNTTRVLFTYYADGAITSDLEVAIENPQGCLFDPPHPQALIVDPKNDRSATATFMMTVPGTSGTINFNAFVNDNQRTSSFNRGTITPYDPASVQLKVSDTFLQVGDSTASITASTTLLTEDDRHQFAGEDIIVWAQGANTQEDAFDTFLDVYLNRDGAPFTDFEIIDFGSVQYKALRIQAKNAFGIIEFYLKPKPGVNCGVVTLNSKVGTQPIVLQSKTVFMFNPIPNAITLAQPDIAYLDGGMLNPPPGDTGCKVSFPVPQIPSISGYAITNTVSGETTVLDAKTAKKMKVVNGIIQYPPFPYSKLVTCPIHNNCTAYDLNRLGYLAFSDTVQVTAYSAARDFYYDPDPSS